MRLRWVGDRTGRLTARDLILFVAAATEDDTTMLWRALNPGDLPLATRLAIDQANVAWLQAVQVARLGGAKVKFEPLYAVGPWAELGPQKVDVLDGQYVEMTEGECLAWLAELQSRQVAV